MNKRIGVALLLGTGIVYGLIEPPAVEHHLPLKTIPLVQTKEAELPNPTEISTTLREHLGLDINFQWGDYGYPSLISNFSYLLKQTGIQEIYTFFETFQEELGINPKYLFLENETKTDGLTHFYFQQKIDGIPVEGGEVLVHINQQNELYYLTSHYYPFTSISNRTLISPEDALKTIKRDLGSDVFGKEPVNHSLIYFPAGNQLILSYKIQFFSEKPLGDWVYFIDASDGGILDRRNELRTVYGTVEGYILPNVGSNGRVKKPVANEYVWVGSQRTTTNSNGYYSIGGSGRVTSRFIGPWTDVRNEDVDEAEFSSGGFTYNISSISYSWENTSNPTGLTGDDQSKLFNLPFSFSFYGNNYNSVYVCTNGFLSFTSSSNTYRPDPIPYSREPNALIAPFWRDLNPYAQGTITYSSSSTKFVVTWNGVKNYSNGNLQTFQVVIYSNGTIEFRYQNITNDVTTSIGVEDAEGANGAPLGTNPGNYTAYRFTPQSGNNPSGEISWIWDYPKTNKHLDEVNMFYHINLIHDFFKGSFGYSGMDYQIRATVYYGTNYANAFYNPRDQNIYFGEGDGRNLLNTARARDVIYHEYTHGVTDHIYANGGGLPYRGESGAMHEAFSDYFAATYTGDPVMGEWVMAPRYQRNISDDYVYPDDWVGEVHDDSRIYSGALWDLRQAIGMIIANRIIFRAYFYYPKEFLEGRDAVIQADRDLYNGAHRQAIIDAFAAHGIGSSQNSYDIVKGSYSWINTSWETGLTGDDQTEWFSLGFRFPFFGAFYSGIYVCTNGWMSFTSNRTTITPQVFPNPTEPNAVIAPYWRDLNPAVDSLGKITYYTGGGKFVMTWDYIRNYGSTYPYRQTFQAVLNSDGTIEFHYKTVTRYMSNTGIGIENADATEGYNFPYNDNSPQNYSSVKFIPRSSGPPRILGIKKNLNKESFYLYLPTVIREGSPIVLRGVSQGTNLHLNIFTPSGRQVFSGTNYSKLPLKPGVYFFNLRNTERLIKSGKFIVIDK